MKYVFVIIVVYMTACSGGGDLPAGEVPSVVYNIVKARFPDVIDIDWKKTTNHYEAEFDLNGVEYNVYVEPGGKIIYYKHDISVASFPAIISERINADYEGYKIEDAEIVQKDSVVYYQAELEAKGKKEVQIIFSADGRQTKQIHYLN